MQIIISPVAGGDNFLLDVDASAAVETLRATIADRLATATGTIKLVCEGLELADGASLAEYFIQPLSTVRVVITGSVSADTADEGSQVISDAEMARAIVVTGMPEAEPAATETAVQQAFSKYGDISRLIFQSDGAGKQHAVLVFAREPSAAAALAAAGQPVLGSPVNVMLANNLGGSKGSKAGPKASQASDLVADLLSSGYLFGVQGVAHVRKMDEAAGVTHRIMVATADVHAVTTNALSSVNAKYRISESVASTYTSAQRQASDLDAKYQISAKANQAAKAASDGAKVAMEAAASTAHSLAGKAMANPHVASAVASGMSFFSKASEAATPFVSHVKESVGSAMAQAKADIIHIETKIKTHAGGASGPAATGAASAPVALPSGNVPTAEAPHAASAAAEPAVEAAEGSAEQEPAVSI